MESVVRDHIMSFLFSKDVLSNMQYGFIEKRSVMLQLLKIIDNWTLSLDCGQQVDIIYTDFEKAFDKVPHRRLLSKLSSYGINEELINWITAFLCGRSQRVRINGDFSLC